MPETALAFTIDDPRIAPCPTTGCWLWLGYLNDYGYGLVVVNRQRRGAHRFAWQKRYGTLPSWPMVLDHMCRVRSCVNPDHMRVVTQRINTIENSDSLPARQRRQTKCPKCGGDYTYQTSPSKVNARECRPCRIARDRKRGRVYRLNLKLRRQSQGYGASNV